MIDHMKKIGTAQEARQLIKNYVEEEGECEGVSKEVCDRWTDGCGCGEEILGSGLRGVVTPEETAALRSKGFSDPFIQELTRDNGRAALKQRVKWLGESGNRVWNMQELVAIGEEAKEYIFRGLESSRDSVREAAIWGLGNLNPDKYKVVSRLREMLRDENVEVRYAAALTLRKLGPKASPAFFDLVQLLKDEKENPELQMAIIRALAAIESDKALLAQTIVPYIDLNWEEAVNLENVVSDSIVDCGIQALPPLLKMLEDRDKSPSQRAKGAEALGKIAERWEGEKKGPLWERGFQVLTQMAKNEEDVTYSQLEAQLQARSQAIRALGFFPRSLDLLWDTLGSFDPEIREASAAALNHFAIAEIQAKLLQKLNSPNWQERHGTLLVIKSFDPSLTAHLLPGVIPLTVDEEVVVAKEADEVVEKFTISNRENFPRLKLLLSHPHEKVRQIAARKVGEIFGEEVRRATTATSRGGAPAFNPAEAIATSLRVLNNQ